MKTLRWILPLAGIGLICLLAVPMVASADDVAWRTSLRLSEPTEIPGQTLPVGDYVIKVVNNTEARSIVQFLNSDGTKVVATVLAIPNHQVRTADTTEFVYFQRAAGSPPALKSWMYPGNNDGVEFVYPKEQAVVLAVKTKEVVYATPVAAEPAIDEPVVVVTPEKKEVPLETYRAQAPVTPAPAVMAAAEPAAKLPKTASDMPLIGLLASVSLLGAAGLRLFVRG